MSTHVGKLSHQKFTTSYAVIVIQESKSPRQMFDRQLIFGKSMYFRYVNGQVCNASNKS